MRCISQCNVHTNTLDPQHSVTMGTKHTPCVSRWPSTLGVSNLQPGGASGSACWGTPILNAKAFILVMP